MHIIFTLSVQIKYLGSTINESSENAYLKGCLNIVFSKKFLLEKVWWKKEERKAYFKKSQLLHCIRGKSTVNISGT